MEKIGSKDQVEPGEDEFDSLPEYEPPRLITYRGEEILDELGPGVTCSFSGSLISC